MYEEHLEKIKTVKKEIDKSLKSFRIEEKKEQLKKVLQEQQNPELFKDMKRLKEVNQKIKRLNTLIEPWKKIQQELSDITTLVEIAEEEQDESLKNEIEQQFTDISDIYKKTKILNFFDDDEHANAYLTIHAGAGGTESCDWVSMLYRLYIRYAEKKGFSTSLIEMQSGEEAGIRSVTILINGTYATGYLRSEIGVHRLVRISPFDANKRRHTSFASVSLTPEINDDISVEISPEDLRIDTFRASGAGGQHVNTTDSAVRMTHLPTNIVVSCQAERSQLQNKDKALKMLKAKLYEYEKEKLLSKKNEEEKLKKKIEWGSQIRSYVFQPYTMVKDHRTNEETGNINNVMDGEIDNFIEAFLLFRNKIKNEQSLE